MTITLTPDVEQRLRDEAEKQNKTPEQVAEETLRENLRAWKMPQSLEELRAQATPLPPGKTLLDLFQEFWKEFPPTETDEEVAAFLERRRR